MDSTGWLEYFMVGLMQQLEEVKNRGAAVIRADVLAKAHRLGEWQSAVLAATHDAGMLALGEREPLFPEVSRPLVATRPAVPARQGADRRGRRGDGHGSAGRQPRAPSYDKL